MQRKTEVRYVDRLAPRIFGHLGDWRGTAAAAAVVERVVETSVIAHHRVDQSSDGLAIGNIDRLPGRIACARQLLEGGHRRGFAPAGDHDTRALAGKRLGGGEPDAAAAARHQRDLVFHVGINRALRSGWHDHLAQSHRQALWRDGAESHSHRRPRCYFSADSGCVHTSPGGTQ
jgi:hypothetical protein